MERILLSKQENDFLREKLICIMRHYTREIDADRTLLVTFTDGMEDCYEQMLQNDIASFELAKGIYKNLLSNRCIIFRPQTFPSQMCNIFPSPKRPSTLNYKLI